MKKEWGKLELEVLDVSMTMDPGKGKHDGTGSNPGQHNGWS